MENWIIIGILLVLVIIAFVHGKKHFSVSGCCGSGSNTIRSKKKLTGSKLGEKIMTIEGMHCENCEIRIENALNRLEGVVGKVSRRKKTATISYSTEISEQVLRETVEQLGYQVTAIR